MAESLIYERNHRIVWTEYKKLVRESNQKSPYMNDRTEPQDILIYSQKKYSTLYNSNPSDEEALCSIKRRSKENYCNIQIVNIL